MAKTPISHLTYKQIGRDWVEEFSLPGLAICPACDAFSANTHYRGYLAGDTIHFSRNQVRRTGIHAFLRALSYEDGWFEYERLWTAAVFADNYALSTYRIRIPASASRWERRRVLALAAREGIKLRTAEPVIYAWATYGDAR